jgi:hypothetical protein
MERRIARWRALHRQEHPPGRMSSSRSAVVRPSSRRPLSRSACATQLRIACADGSNSLASSSGLRPGSNQLYHLPAKFRRIGRVLSCHCELRKFKRSGVHESGATSAMKAPAGWAKRRVRRTQSGIGRVGRPVPSADPAIKIDGIFGFHIGLYYWCCCFFRRNVAAGAPQPVSTAACATALEIRAEWDHSSDVAWSRLGLGLSDAKLAVCLRGAIFDISFWWFAWASSAA